MQFCDFFKTVFQSVFPNIEIRLIKLPLDGKMTQRDIEHRPCQSAAMMRACEIVLLYFL